MLVCAVKMRMWEPSFEPFYVTRMQQRKRWIAQFGDVERWPFPRRTGSWRRPVLYLRRSGLKPLGILDADYRAKMHSRFAVDRIGLPSIGNVHAQSGICRIDIAGNTCGLLATEHDIRRVEYAETDGRLTKE